ncbi:hypothetical protein NSQ61_01000 [Aeribacillus sp. FSL K6-1121]|uniref:hypothetical protein n=1 Tax=Aeribacillus TaxID=1055323 RepID=UPI002E1C7475|nr:hypothetical protein [Aeribacillus composti]
MNFKEIHQRFIESGLPYKYSIDEVSNILEKKYQAKKRDQEDFQDLNSDPFVNRQNIVYCYTIDDEEVLNNILSQEEKKERDYIKKQILNDQKLSQEEKNQIIKDETAINIIIESDDQKFISNFTIQGSSNQILNEFIIFKGINEEDCVLGNEEYEYFLRALVRGGYIN